MSSLCGRRNVGEAGLRAATISAVSSTERVVWVMKASLAGSRAAEGEGVGDGLDQQ
jgi:hypothetical protein